MFSFVGAGSTALHYAACGGNAQCCQVSPQFEDQRNMIRTFHDSDP